MIQGDLFLKRKTLSVPVLAEPSAMADHNGEAIGSTGVGTIATNPSQYVTPIGAQNFSDSDSGSMLCPRCGGYEKHEGICL